MIAFPPAKINLGLSIISKRSDGYHNLESVFYPVPLCDVLEMVVDPSLGPNALHVTYSGLPIPGDTQSNLIVKAHAILSAHQTLPGIRAQLHKVIPMGGGLGGGSSNGTWALRLMNDLCAIHLDEQTLLEFAAQLGSDCPFFMFDRACKVEGRGERIEPLDLNLAAWHWLIVNPGIHSSTAEAFAGVKPQMPRYRVFDCIAQPVETWKGRLVNDFEAGLGEKYPAIAQGISKLYDAGAVYAAMTGSGATFYGLFREAPPQISFPESHRVLHIAPNQ